MNRTRSLLLTIAILTLAWIPATSIGADGRAPGAISEVGVLTRGVSQAGAEHATVTCPPQWAHGFHIPNISGVASIGVFDDGSGPALYIGGSFDKAWDVWARTIVKWDGQTWAPLPGAFGPYNPWVDEIPVVKAMVVFDDGSGAGLFVGGCFATAGDVVVNTIAKWDGREWSALGQGIDAAYSCTSGWWSPGVNALAVFDDGTGAALYAGGDFAFADGAPASNIAKWNGTSWSALGIGLDGTVHALAVFDDGTGAALYCGGESRTPEGGVTDAIAKWDGNSWSTLSTGIDGTVYALAVYDDGSGPDLYAGGDFAIAGGLAAGHIAKWDGFSWSSVGGGLVGDTGVRSLTVFAGGSGPALYAGGQFTRAGEVEANRIARWAGKSWSAVGGGIDPLPAPLLTGYDAVDAMTVFDRGGGPRLFVAGSFESVGGVYAHGMAQWDGTTWSPMQGAPGAGLNGWVFDLTPGDDGTGPGLFAGGSFTQAAGRPLNRIGKWNGISWSSLGTGMNNQVNGITFFDDGVGPALFAAGAFTEAGGVPANRVAKWSGGEWTPLGDGLGDSNTQTVFALAAVHEGPAYGLYAGGNFTRSGGRFVNRISRWDGTAWSGVGGGVDSWVFALTSFDDGTGPQLYAGGWFWQAGGVAANRVARWDGASWHPVGNGLPDNVNKLTVVDDGSGPTLFAGWEHGISKWSGDQWILVGSTGPSYSPVYGIAYFDDGGGPALFAAGYFGTIGGVPARHIAKWNGSTWIPLAGYIDLAVYDLAVFNDGKGPGLFLGGDISRAGDTTSSNMAKWYVPPPCSNHLIPEPDGNKTRSLSFKVSPSVTATGSGSETAIKITLIDLQNPNPPNLPQYPPPDFSAYESATCTAAGEGNVNGCARWVGKPGTFLESQDDPGLGNYRAARLQCTPYYTDWVAETASGPIAVVGAEIAPSSEYRVQTYDATCNGLEFICTKMSAPVTMLTRRYGDVEAPFNPPATSTQPDVIDVAQLVNHFKKVTGAPIKAIAQLQPNVPELNADVNVLDILAVVDGFKQFAYPFGGPCACPSAVTCGSTTPPAGTPCTSETPCVTAFGAGSLCVKLCSGGTNAGEPCINDSHCPGSTCGSGFCRDRCGRCTP